MIAAYLDTSVVTRIVLDEPDPLLQWNSLEVGISSQLLRIESHRALERLWRNDELSEEEFERKRTQVDVVLRSLQLIEIDQAIVAAAARPFATWVASLDAIHLATAIEYRRSQPHDARPLLFATHDRQLAKAAAAMQFDVIGI